MFLSKGSGENVQGHKDIISIVANYFNSDVSVSNWFFRLFCRSFSWFEIPVILKIHLERFAGITQNRFKRFINFFSNFSFFLWNFRRVSVIFSVSFPWIIFLTIIRDSETSFRLTVNRGQSGPWTRNPCLWDKSLNFPNSGLESIAWTVVFPILCVIG